MNREADMWGLYVCKEAGGGGETGRRVADAVTFRRRHPIFGIQFVAGF